MYSIYSDFEARIWFFISLALQCLTKRINIQQVPTEPRQILCKTRWTYLSTQD
jgi:hypothetical protein